MRFRVKIISILASLLIAGTCCSCSTSLSSSSDGNSSSGAVSGAESTSSISDAEKLADDMFTERDISGDYDESTATQIQLGSEIKVNGDGASANGSDLTISQEGVYILTGTLPDGKIVVDCADETAKVQLVLKNAEIKCSDYAPVYVNAADKVFLTLAENTNNIISDGGEYVLAEEDSNVDGAIFSRSTLTINGSGALTVNGTQNHAIVSKDDIKITGGELTVDSVGDAIQGKDSVRICDGKIIINAGEDAVKATNAEEEDKGFVYINGGELSIDAVDDGVHAEKNLTIKGGIVNINSSYEGLEGESINIDAGTISVVSSDDGINVAGGSDGTTYGRPMEFQNAVSANCKLVITGGYLFVDAGGDGLDSNGTMSVEGGVVLVSGPENSGNGAIDYEGSATITGGSLIALGSSGMSMGFGEDSTQNSFMTNLSSGVQANTSIAITDTDGNVILSFTSKKSFRNIVASSASLELNKEYNIVVGATVEKADGNGYANSGSLSGGSVDSTITLTSVATNNGGAGGMGGMGGRDGGGMGGFGRM